MISRKHSIIIKYLAEKDEYVTAAELSQQIDASIRTVKRYIKDLNYFLDKDGVEITSVKGIGYKIQGAAKDIKRVLDEADMLIEGFNTDDSLDGRVTKALCVFLNDEYVSAEELSEKLNLSIPSTNKLISSVKDTLKKYGLKIISKPHHGSKIVGSEIKIRSLILDYGIKTNDNGLIEVRLDNISAKEIEEIERIITEILKRSNIIISDRDFNELLTRIIISISRIRSKHLLGKEALSDSYITDSYNLIKNIMIKIEENLNIGMEETEIQYVSSSSGIIPYNYNTGKPLSENNEDKMNKFIDDILQELSLITGVDFRNDTEFLNAFTMHLKIFINRSRAGVNAKNPLLNQIKSKFPMETNLATLIAKRLQEEFNVSLNEDEIGFIAMHLGVAFERIRDKGSKKVCIICHYGIGTSRLLAEKLKRRISDINIIGTYPVRYLEMALEQDIDFIVSTVKLEGADFKVPVIYIENVFSDEIVNELNEIFNEKDEKKRIFKDVFNREAFFTIKAETREEAIENLGREMKAKKFIDDDVIAKIFEREKMSSTDMNHFVAIPHTILDGEYKSIIGVGRLEKPIIWNKQEVQLIFMVCFNRKESYNFPIFKYLYNFIEDEGNIRRLLKVYNFDKFMEILNGR